MVRIEWTWNQHTKTAIAAYNMQQPPIARSECTHASHSHIWNTHILTPPNTEYNRTQSSDRPAKLPLSASHPHCTVIILIVYSRYVLMSHQMQTHSHGEHFTSGFRGTITLPHIRTHTYVQDSYHICAQYRCRCSTSQTSRSNYNKRLRAQYGERYYAHCVKRTMSSCPHPLRTNTHSVTI